MNRKDLKDKIQPDGSDISTAIIRGIAFAIAFGLLVLLVIAALFMFNTRGEFVKALRGEVKISLSFYLSTLIVIVVSSILFTPFSFGISYYFINSKAGTGKFSQVFYLFRRPSLMLRAIAVNTLKKILLNLWRVVILAFAVLAECGVFAISIALSGENIFEYESDFLAGAAQYVTHDTFFIALTIAEWCIVLLLLIYCNMRYMMCKYALIRFPQLRVIEAIRVGVFSIRGRVFKTYMFYLGYIAYCIFTFITMGLNAAASKAGSHDTFSTYAVRIVENGIEAYYLKRSL